LNSDVPCEAANNCYSPPQTVENWLDGSSSVYIFTNVDGHIPGIPALERNYGSLQISAEKRFSDRWQILGSGVAFYFQTGRPRTKTIGVAQDNIGFITSHIPTEPRGAS
jgi:hypothetical protein